MTTSANRVVYDLTFTKDGLSEIPEDLQSNNYMKLLEVFVERLNKVQLTAISLAYARLLDNASGDILTSIASRFFIDRNDLTDAELKASIQMFALRQDSEGTRNDIYKLLKIISGEGGFVNIYKGKNNRVEVCISLDCLNLSSINVTLSELFPVNTNLQVLGASALGTPFGVVSAYDTESSSRVGALGSAYDNYYKTNTIANIIVDDERGYN
jgi:hypothetical protein